MYAPDVYSPKTLSEVEESLSQSQASPFGGIRKFGGEDRDPRRADELRDVTLRGTIKDLLWRAYLDDLSLAHHSNPVGECHRFALIVGNEEHCLADSVVKVFQFGAQSRSRGSVEMGEGLVKEEGCRVANDSFGDGNPLPFGGVEPGGPPVEDSFNAEKLRRGKNPLVNLVPGHPLSPKRKGDVLANGQVRIKGVKLKHHRDIPLARRQTRDISIVKEHLSGGGRLQAGNNAERCRLAAAGRTQQRDELPILNGQVKGFYRFGVSKSF